MHAQRLRLTGWIAPTLASLVSLAMVTACSDRGGDGDGVGVDDGDTGINLDAGDGDGDAGDAGEEGGRSPFFDVIGGNDDDAGSGTDAGCADLQVTVDQPPPTLVLLIDQSGSMTSNFGGQDRWDAVEETLFDPGNGVVGQLEDRVRFGMALYTSQGGFGGGTCPQLVEAAPAIGNRDTLASIYAQNKPKGDTPTGESLIAVAEDLANAGLEGPLAVVVATDGEPDTCAQPNPQNGQDEAVEAAQDAHALGVETYIISVGNDVSDTHLQEMANAGKGLAPSGGQDAPFYKALDNQELIDAFGDIVAGVISCEFEVDGIVDVDEMCSGTVTLDGQELDCMTQWDMPTESTLRLLGDACDTLKDGQAHEVDATFPCGVVTIP